MASLHDLPVELVLQVVHFVSEALHDPVDTTEHIEFYYTASPDCQKEIMEHHVCAGFRFAQTWLGATRVAADGARRYCSVHRKSNLASATRAAEQWESIAFLKAWVCKISREWCSSFMSTHNDMQQDKDAPLIFIVVARYHYVMLC
jgi:hypothetical protein